MRKEPGRRLALIGASIGPVHEAAATEYPIVGARRRGWPRYRLNGGVPRRRQTTCSVRILYLTCRPNPFRILARVKDVMTPDDDIPRVTAEKTVLEAARVMNERGTSAVAVVNEDGKVVGFFGERTLLTEFVKLNAKPDEVRVGKIVHILPRIRPNATTKEAAKVLVDSGATRLAVYDADRFLGWVTLTDLSREFSRESLLDRLRSRDVPEEEEVRCPNCNKAFMEKVTDKDGMIVRWQCPNCKYAL